jgi:probable F420-dependent oxidoreductase
MVWPESPVNKLRELVLGVRAIWHSWQTGAKLNFRGQYFKLTLMSPFFNPGPIPHPHIPISIAGVNVGLARLAGEVCDGFHVHPFHTAQYLRQVLRPAIAVGAAKAGRNPAAVQVASSVFVVTNPQERAFTCQQIAFYASTPSYRAVLELHGWGAVGEQLSKLAVQGAWAAMPALITEEMLHTFALVAPLAELATPLRERYAGLLDRVSLYRPFISNEETEGWQTLARTL